VLQFPVIDALDHQRLQDDEMVKRRLLEVEFGVAAHELRQLAKKGNRRATLKKLEAMDQRFGEHAWLKAKMAQLHRLAEVDMDMMMKEASFSSMKMSSRLASKSESLYMGDETESFMPAFLRKKESEGRGRKNET
jgi:hypothetical protein